MCVAPKGHRLPTAALLLFLAAGVHAQDMAAVVPEEQPPSVERFEEPAAAPAGQTNNADFRFTYPVRDTQTDQIYTEVNPPATGDAPSETAAESTTATPAEQSRAATAGNSAEEDAETSLELAEETLIGEENLPQQSWADIGEGRFEKRPFRYSFAVYEGYNSNVEGSSTDPVESL